MAAFLPSADQTLTAADIAHKAERDVEPNRNYLGCSSIGKACRRALWYEFRHCTERDINPSGYRAIEDGERGETVIVKRIRRVKGVDLLDIDPGTGRPFAVEAISGHLRGHLDGAVHELLQAPKTWTVFEAKVCNEKKFNVLVKLRTEDEKGALEKWDAVYFGQAQMYMGLTGMSRHWLVCATPGVRDWTAVRTEFNKAYFDRLLDKARKIIEATEPLERISEDPKFFQCGWCAAKAICHERAIPAPNCRNCCHATPEMDGKARWSCFFHSRDLTLTEQRAGCSDHVYIPALIPFDLKDGSEAGNYAEYVIGEKLVRNGSGDTNVYSSAEWVAAQVGNYEALTNQATEYWKLNFGATIETRAVPPAVFDPDEALEKIDEVLRQ